MENKEKINIHFWTMVVLLLIGISAFFYDYSFIKDFLLSEKSAWLFLVIQSLGSFFVWLNTSHPLFNNWWHKLFVIYYLWDWLKRLNRYANKKGF